MRILSLSITGAVVLTVACSSAEAPGAPVTVQVTNTTCAQGACKSIQVFAYPDDQPHTPGGAWRLTLGTVAAATGCVVLPPIAHFYVIAVDGARRDTDATYTWTTAHRVAFGTAPTDGSSPISSGSTTEEIVPLDADGWSVALPGNGKPVPGPPCTP